DEELLVLHGELPEEIDRDHLPEERFGNPDGGEGFARGGSGEGQGPPLGGARSGRRGGIHVAPGGGRRDGAPAGLLEGRERDGVLGSVAPGRLLRGEPSRADVSAERRDRQARPLGGVAKRQLFHGEIRIECAATIASGVMTALSSTGALIPQRGDR